MLFFAEEDVKRPYRRARESEARLAGSGVTLRGHPLAKVSPAFVETSLRQKVSESIRLGTSFHCERSRRKDVGDSVCCAGLWPVKTRLVVLRIGAELPAIAGFDSIAQVVLTNRQRLQKSTSGAWSLRLQVISLFNRIGSSSSVREHWRSERASEAGSTVAKPRARWRALLRILRRHKEHLLMEGALGRESRSY